MWWRLLVWSRFSGESRFQQWEPRISIYKSDITATIKENSLKFLCRWSVSVCACMNVCIRMNVWEYLDLQMYQRMFYRNWRQDFYVIDSDLQLCSLQERRHPSPHTPSLCRSDRLLCFSIWEIRRMEVAHCHTLTQSTDLSLSISLSPCREPDPFVFCSLFASKSHHGSMQSNEPAQSDREAGGKTGRQRGRKTG